MTRDGLIEVNETKETAKRVSRREREADFSKPKEQPASDMPQAAQEEAAQKKCVPITISWTYADRLHTFFMSFY